MNMIISKACPVVIRKDKERYELLAFEHPQAGCQIVKGSVEHGEALESACERELLEESGLIGRVTKNLGIWDSNFKGQIWGFCEVTLNSTPEESWTHYCLDDGGHHFRFFWQPLSGQLGNSWHPLFQGAIEYIKNAVSMNELK